MHCGFILNNLSSGSYNPINAGMMQPNCCLIMNLFYAQETNNCVKCNSRLCQGERFSKRETVVEGRPRRLRSVNRSIVFHPFRAWSLQWISCGWLKIVVKECPLVIKAKASLKTLRLEPCPFHSWERLYNRPVAIIPQWTIPMVVVGGSPSYNNRPSVWM